MSEGDTDERFFCDYCNEPIGVYEPIVVIIDGEPVHGSRAAGGIAAEDRPRFHGACLPRARAAGRIG